MLWIHQRLLYFRSKFNIMSTIPQFLACHIQSALLPNTRTPTPPCIDQGFSSLFQSQAAVVLSPPPNKGLSHTSGNCCNLTSLFLLYLSPSSSRSPRQRFLCIIERAAGNQPRFICRRLCFSTYAITRVIFLAFIPPPVPSLGQPLGGQRECKGSISR